VKLGKVAGRNKLRSLGENRLRIRLNPARLILD
jgi:hypothetical protein